MTNEERLLAVFSQFDTASSHFCKNTRGIACEISGKYKGVANPRNLTFRFATVYYNSFVVKFKYTAHGIMDVTNSILECLIYLDKSENAVGIPLPCMVDYCEMDTATPLCIPYISNEEGMRQAFNCIGSVLEPLLDTFAVISSDIVQKAAVLRAFKRELFLLSNTMPPENTDEIPDEILEISEKGYRYLTFRFSSAPYTLFLKGNLKKAIKQLEKQKTLSGYERRLLNLWKSNQPTIYPDLSAITAMAQRHNDADMPKANFKEFAMLFLSWLLMTPVFSVLYLAVYFSIMYMEGGSSVYLMGPIYNFPVCILAGFITAIAASYFTRLRFYKWFFKKDYETYCEMDSMHNSVGADNLMKGFLSVVIVLGLATCILSVKWNLNFLQNGFWDNSDFFSLQGEYYDYSDIEKIYFLPERTNAFDETLEYPSYVLVLKNGKEIDLYDLDDVEQYEDTLLPFLREKNIPIEGPTSQ